MRTRLCLPRALPLKHPPRILGTQSCLVLSFRLRLCYPGSTRSSGFPGLRDSAFKTALYINDIYSIQNDLLVISFGSFSSKSINPHSVHFIPGNNRPDSEVKTHSSQGTIPLAMCPCPPVSLSLHSPPCCLQPPWQLQSRALDHPDNVLLVVRFCLCFSRHSLKKRTMQ